MTTDTGLLSRLTQRAARIAVVGLGYVGLPLACVLAEAGYPVVGLDCDTAKVRGLLAGACPIGGEEPGLSDLLDRVLAAGRLALATQPEALHGFDVAIICVATPIDTASERPDYAALKSALATVGAHLRPGALVIVESTLAPDSMRLVVEPALRTASGLSPDDYLLAHCPERVSPGALLANLRDMPRIVGGWDEGARTAARTLYAQFCRAPIWRTDCLSAEIAKTAENTYRDVQIAFANELAILCGALGADVWHVRELINARHDRHVLCPGPGVGGHCIPKDPWLLIANAPPDFEPWLLSAARTVNDLMPAVVAVAACRWLHDMGLNPRLSRIALLGYSYREDTDDARNSPSEALAGRLIRAGVDVRIHDPHVPGYGGDWREVVEGADLCLLAVGHRAYREIDLGELCVLLRTPLLLDARAFWAPEEARGAGLSYRRLGAGEGRA